MDQQSVETLLRRLVQRVEESERRYSEALADLHARLDRLSQATGATRLDVPAEDAKTFERLHEQVSSLAQRLERESSPLDDFERLGRALSGELGLGDGATGVAAKPDLLSELASSSFRPSEPPQTVSPFASPAPYATSPAVDEDRDLDKKLVEMAHRLENSITTALPATALEALNARLDEIAAQINQAIGEGAKGLAFEPFEQKLADIAAQLGRAEMQLAKVGAIETALTQLIDRVDASASHLEAVAEKAAGEAARRVASEVKLDAATAERLEAMHRDLLAMGERTREKDERLAGTIEAVHGSLKQLVQIMEHPPQPPKLKLPFAERLRQLEPQPSPAEAQADEMPPVEAPAPVAPETSTAPKNRLAAALSELEQAEMAPNFGRAKPGKLESKAAEAKRDERARAGAKTEESSRAADDLIAAARRAAQAAALKAEQRSTSRFRRLPGDAEAASSGEPQARRKRSYLIIFAALLLAISALLLYARLASKGVEPPAQGPATESGAAPSVAPPAPEPNASPSAPSSGSSELPRQFDANPAGEAVGDAGGNFTDVAKSLPGAVSEVAPQVQPASILAATPPALPPGVVISIQDSASGPQAMLDRGDLPAPQNLPLPPEELGPISLRQAAAQGDPRAQYAIALRYAQGDGTPQNLVEAARWFERAAGAGLAPAQYRLGAMYERGQGVARDLGRARSWYQAAAEKGNVKAMHNLAVNLSSGANTADYAAAAKWFAEAAAYGLADSQFNLGILTEHGLGTTKNLVEAYKWFALAAKSGDAEAAKRRDAVAAQLDPASLAEAGKALTSWTAKQAPAEANEVAETEDTADAAATPNTALVSRAQSLLNKLGYDAGTPDGLMGTRTREAIRSFERKNGLEETGTVSVPLVTKLERLAG